MIVIFFVEEAAQEDFRTQTKADVYTIFTRAWLNCIIM